MGDVCLARSINDPMNELRVFGRLAHSMSKARRPFRCVPVGSETRNPHPDYLHFPSYYPPGLDTSGTLNVVETYCEPTNWSPSSKRTTNLAVWLIGKVGHLWWAITARPPFE